MCKLDSQIPIFFLQFFDASLGQLIASFPGLLAAGKRGATCCDRTPGGSNEGEDVGLCVYPGASHARGTGQASDRDRRSALVVLGEGVQGKSASVVVAGLR